VYTVLDWSEDRATITGRAEDLKSRASWNIRQIGEIVTEREYRIDFVIKERATDISLLEENREYRLRNVKIGTYEGNPQLQIDSETSVEPLN